MEACSVWLAVEQKVAYGTVLSVVGCGKLVTNGILLEWWAVEHRVAYGTQLTEVGCGTQGPLWNPAQLMCYGTHDH